MFNICIILMSCFKWAEMRPWIPDFSFSREESCILKKERKNIKIVNCTWWIIDCRKYKKEAILWDQKLYFWNYHISHKHHLSENLKKISDIFDK